MFGDKRYRRARIVVGNITVSLTPTSIPVNGRDCVIESVIGNTWVNPLDIASSTEGNSYKLAPENILELNVDEDVSLVSDAVGSTVQIIIYE